MNDKKRYKEIFSQIQPTKELDWEKMVMKKQKKHLSRQMISIAAVVTVLTGMCLAAYTTNFFGLRDLLLPGINENSQGGLTQEHREESVDVISLVGFSNTKEAKAAAEWHSFLANYDDGGALEQLGNGLSGFEEDYGLYPVYTQEMADKLDEITERYGLKLHSSMLLVSAEELCGQIGGNFCGDNRFGVACLYEDGTFHFDGAIELAGQHRFDYQFLRAVRGSFTDTRLTIGSLSDYTEWTYTTQDGTAVTLALSAYKALVIADLPDCFVTINVLAGTDPSGGSLSAETLEQFADSFAFRLLTPARPADIETLRIAQQSKEQEDHSQFRTNAGMEMQTAQDFYAELIQNIENGDRIAVAEKLLYPATVTRWQTSETGTHPIEITVRDPEEFLPYYDFIFTESLWWDCIMANQYTKDRAALSAANGMVSAADGAIWFTLTEDGDIRVFAVQSNEGCSIRCGTSSSDPSVS